MPVMLCHPNRRMVFLSWWTSVLKQAPLKVEATGLVCICMYLVSWRNVRLSSKKKGSLRPWPPENAFGRHRCCEKFGSPNGTLLVHRVFAACHNRMGRLMVLALSCLILFQPWISLSLSSVMGRIVLLRVYLEHRRSEVAIVSNQFSHRMWWDLST